ncbi:PREDICTED: platelet glycoprotein VI [Elephantulus edwardii]|uniref:platelet glycoprotein VI n=1 Tax=Elephantulus edwardii TaxID=28737 RepID=UPI0003F0CC29|nr:PREDICTED: platelet glycoprotein VI [Elephantulus edwardii]
MVSKSIIVFCLVLCLAQGIQVQRGVFQDRPSLMAHPGPHVTSGGNVTLLCQVASDYDVFHLFKDGADALSQDYSSQDNQVFFLSSVTRAHEGSYTCYCSRRNKPLLWSLPSKPLDLLVTDAALKDIQLEEYQQMDTQVSKAEKPREVTYAQLQEEALIGRMEPLSSYSLRDASKEPLPLPKPSLRASPSTLVPLKQSVIIQCKGPQDVGLLYRLEKLHPKSYSDESFLYIPAMKQSHAGQYRCSYQNGSAWSRPSDLLDLIATGVYSKPTLSAWPSTAVSTGQDVTLQCQDPYGHHHFALYKEGDSGSTRSSDVWYRASFPIITVTTAHSGTYRCYSFSGDRPYLWSHPSDPLQLVVTGTSVTPSLSPTEPPSSVPELSESSSKLIVSPKRKEYTTGTSRSVTTLPGGSNSPTGLALQNYTKSNVIRIALGAAILLFLVGILAEDWHSRQTLLTYRARAIQRPLPPLPQTLKPHVGLVKGQPYGYSPECRHQDPI